MSHEDVIKAMSMAMLPEDDRELVQQYINRSFDNFFHDLQQVGKKNAENILLVMNGYDEYVDFRDYKSLQDKGWVFIPDDHDLDHPNKYGFDANGRPRMGCRVESPNYLFSVTIFDVKRFINSQELYSEFFSHLFRKK